MIVRARHKSVDQLSPDYSCCDQFRKVHMGIQEVVFEVDLASKFESTSVCRFCKRALLCHGVTIVRFVSGHEAFTKGLPRYTALEEIDLDEGPIAG